MDENEAKQKYMEYQMLEQQMKKYQQNMEILQEQMIEVETIRQGVIELKTIKKGQEILVPISNGIFCKAKIETGDDFIVNVGSNTMVNKKNDEVMDMIIKQADDIRDVREKFTRQMQLMQIQMREIEEDVIKPMMQMQQG